MKLRKWLSLLLSISMLLSITGTVALAETEEKTTVIDYFLEPDAIAKPMARMWFPDASAGIDENDTIAKQINALAEEGFGGVEIAFLADASNYSNAQLDYAGWGSEAWVELLKKVYTAANAVEDGFVVDLTITSHWPPCLNTIDPNDDAASQELSSSFTKVTADMLAAGSAELTLPETKMQDAHNANFIFTDRLTSAVLVQVAEVDGDVLVLDYETVQRLDTQKITVESTEGLEEGSFRTIDGVTYLGSAAGIPDEATCEKYGWIYSDPEEDAKYTNESVSTVGVFGPAPEEGADLSASYNGKIDENGNRARMADWQYLYSADLNGLELGELNNDEAISAGDWVIFGAFLRGTGQIFSGSAGEADKQITMKNRVYVTNYFDSIGIEVVEDYWNEYILCDEELVEMMKINGAMGAAIFEDSIEATTNSSYWVYDINEEIADFYGEDYAYADIMPMVLMSSTQEATVGFGPAAEVVEILRFVNIDEATISEVEEDYNTLMGKLYNEQHCEVSNAWAASIGYSYRAQTYSITGMDVAGAAASVDIPEAENAQTGDGHRLMSSAVNMFDKQCLSAESVTGAMIYAFNWEDIISTLNAYFSGGVNHVILHGSAYSKSLNGELADWPGWDPFIGRFGEPYTYRQTYWEDMEMLANYLARTQAVLQHGTAKIDIAVLIDDTDVFRAPSGRSLPTLLNNGYSYNLMSKAILQSENASKTEGGVIYADGPAYKAVVLKEVTTMSAESMDILIAYAEAGIPIVAMNSDPSGVYGTEKDAETDAAVVEKYAKLLTYDCVATCETEEELPDILRALGVESHARYEEPMHIETTLYRDAADGTNYYYLYNCTELPSGMLTAGSAKKYKVTEGANEAILDVAITLDGEGVPYVFDAVTGEITEVGEYTINGDGTVTVIIDELAAANSIIIAIGTSEALPAAADHVVSVNADRADYEIVRKDGQLYLRTEKSGVYEVTMASGEVKTIEVSEASAALDLADAEWTLVIDSYGPTYKDAHTMYDELGIQTVDPSDTTITTVDFGTVTLGNWEDLAATEEQLAEMGVESIEDVSGKGYYTASFEWDGSDAILSLSYGNDQITGITINGEEIYPINNMIDKVDLKGYLVEGENTIVIELTTTLSARANVEHKTLREGSGLHFGGVVFSNNGLNGLVLTPYMDAEI